MCARINNIFIILGTTGSGELLQIAKNEKKVQDYYTGPFPCNISRKVFVFV